MKKIVIGTLFIATIFLIIYFLQKEKLNSNYDVDIFLKLKTECKITQKSPFTDLALGVKFQFKNDELVCDRILDKQREIFIWKKENFFALKPTRLGEGITGEIIVNPLPGLPQDIVIKEESMTLLGKLVKVKTVQPSSCKPNSCPTSRVIEIEHNDKVLKIEEFSSDSGLFQSIEENQ